MQFTIVQLITSGLLLFGASATFAANGFANTCTNISYNETWLEADCPKTGNGQKWYASLDLNGCLSYNGHLVCGGSGYAYECYGCELAGSTNLTCSCGYEEEEETTKHIDLNKCIGVDDFGDLYC
ncbi:Cyanovirin-N [Hygrophoropsis aurantiaca]|uniref:Cyanovirin-N n=1 Tax=Hygrophoropsis aurantiaca TaxID=72124 RepID=A0ACB8A1Q6_9AGAM|nr:Cyanovirin-N [Hygrophoropsis aurantiaca]